MIKRIMQDLAMEIAAGAVQNSDPAELAKLQEAYWRLQYVQRLGLLDIPEIETAHQAAKSPDDRASGADELLRGLATALIQNPDVLSSLSAIHPVLSTKAAQLASAERLLQQVGGSQNFLKIEVARLRADLHAFNQNRILTIPYTVEGIEDAAESQQNNFNFEKVDLAIKQALGTWSAVTPLIFRPPLAGQEPMLRIKLTRDRQASGELGTASGFISSTASGPVGVCTVTIDCDNQLFVDKFLEELLIHTGAGPFDFIAVLAHEIGHAIGLDHPPVDPVTGQETEEALMGRSFGTGQVERTLSPYDLREARRLHGELYLGETVIANLAQTGVLADAPPSVQIQQGSWGMIVFGPVNTRALLDIVVPAKDRLLNSLQLKFTTVSSAVFINRVETFDGIIPLQQFALSARGGSIGLQGTRFELQFGFLERRSLENDLLVRLEIYFSAQGTPSSSEFGVLQIEEVSAGTLPAPMVLDPGVKFVD